jgi:FG-GAP-like repeat/Bacterial pre-peptidase C-terminal domain
MLPTASPLDLATPLRFESFNIAHVSHVLAQPNEFDLYAAPLQSGDTIDVNVNASTTASGLASLLRIFDAAGTPLALDNQQGGDPHLKFQVAAAGVYYIGVSSAPDNNYNPRVPGTGAPGLTTGRYDLTAQITNFTPLLPDMAGSSFRTGADMAAAGDAIPIDFTVQNRGGANPGRFSVQLLLSQSNSFDRSSRVLATLARSDLVADATGRSFSSLTGFGVTLPAGVASGPALIGLRIIPDPNTPDAGLYDKSGVHRGADWEPLAILSRAPAGATDLPQVDPMLFTASSGALSDPGQVDSYPFTVSDALGSGELKAEVAASSAAHPRLSLFGPTGQILIQSDSGQLVQPLQPGKYVLAVSAVAQPTAYRLSTTFTRTSQPFAQLTTGAGAASVAAADVNGDGFSDVITANRIDQTVSVFLGNGDGAFAPPKSFAAGPRMWRVTMADFNNDGRPDVITGNKGNNTVSILLGNGDGTFQPQIVVPAGTRVGGAIAVDVNGDGFPDLVEDNYAADTIWVLKGDGNGAFEPATIYPTDDQGRFQGVGQVTAADVNGDGVPDLVYPTYIGANVAVRLGAGDGTFGAPRTFAARRGCYAVKVLDLNGDGKPDVVAVNAVDNSVSVLFGNGDGTLQPQNVYPVGANPYSMAVADVNGDGHPDAITSNRDENTVSVLLGKADGTFLPAQIFQTGKTPRRVAAADFNGDGQVDLVAVDQGEDAADVLRGNGDGAFSTGGRSAAPAPDLRPFQEVVADLNGDGRPDIATANRSDSSVSVLLSNADGSFQTRETFATDTQPFSVTAADVNGDGIPDLVTANYAGSSVSVLLGNGDGTFRPHRDIPAGSAAYDARVADVNGDGKPDVIVANKNDNNVGVLLGNGDGSFQPQKTYPVASGPYEVVVKDVDRNGVLDVVVSHFSATVIDVLLGNGDGTFQPTRQYPVGSRPYGLAVADLNGDGKPDVVTANYRSNNASVLLGAGDGSFGPPHLVPVGSAPNEAQIEDVNGDGIPDVVTANYGGNSVSLLLGKGDGGFFPPRTFPAGNGPASVAIADVNGDGLFDLVVGNRKNSTVQVLSGNGDGSFQPPVPFGVGKNRYSIAVADLNGDGKPDVVSTRLLQNSLTVQLGDGTGSFERGQTVAVGSQPTAVTIADLNGDGRPDLVTANTNANSVSVILGNGDGTFNVQRSFSVGRAPRSVAVADINGDGILDLIVANYDDNTASLLLGDGDGGFHAGRAFAVGSKPYAIKAADLNGDGRPDVVTANAAGDTVSVLLGDGRGAFPVQRTFAAGKQPFSVAIADVNGDGVPDLVTADAFDDTVSVLDGNGDGSFRSPRTFAAGSRPYSVAVVDVNGDGKPDIVATNYVDHDASVLLNSGGGSFSSPRTFATDLLPVQTVVADVNGDGRPDLLTATNHDSATGVLLGRGDGTFQPATAASGVALRDTPFLVDLNGDGTPDSIVLNRSGDILFRKGLAGASHALAPPVILNPGRPARDITILRVGNGLAVAAGDAHYDSSLSTSRFMFTVSLYRVAADLTVSRRTAFAAADLPVRLAAADLTGDGLQSLVAANPLDDSVTIALQTSPGSFGAPITAPVGVVPSDIAFADVTGDGLLDVVVSDQASGDVSVLLNNASHSFVNSLRFRATTLRASLEASSGAPALDSPGQSVSVIAGRFTNSGRIDLLVVNRGAHSFTVLSADGQGGLTDPKLALTTSTSDGFLVNNRPGAIVAGDFNRDGRQDLAVLMEDAGQVWIYNGDGNGAFHRTYTIPVGDQATGLSVAPGAASGLLDLLVGNGFGDVLHLTGKGDGTFQISGNRVSLSVVPDLLGPGQAGVLVGNQQNNRVTVQAPSADGNQYTAVQTLAADSPSAQLAPGDVHWSVLDKGSTLPDAVVVSTGSNAVVVYRTTAVSNGAPVFAPAPRTYFVGTSPVGVAVADVNDDGVPDMLVANQGSNDISVLFGSYDANGAWSGIAGPRLKSGGDGPIAVAVRQRAGGLVPDLAVLNGGSGTMTLLPGVGGGFFDDRQPKTLFNLESAVVQPPTFVGGSGLGFAVTAGGALVRFDMNNPAAGSSVVFSSQQVLAAQALPNGQVVVALANGAVELLRPVGNVLGVDSVLQTEGGSVSLASAIEVVAKPSGQFDVLVSSQGSDTISVFGQAAAPSVAGAPTAGGPAPVSASSIPAPVVGATQTFAATANSSAATSSSSSASTGSSSSASAAAVSAAVTTAMGLSLGGFTSLGNGATKETGEAALVAVEGNTYLSVPILDFGSENDEELARGQGRLPKMATPDALGDASPLNRFIMGLDDALLEYRRAKEEPPRKGEEPSGDPWNEDLFYRRLPTPRPAGAQEKIVPMDGDGSSIPKGGELKAPVVESPARPGVDACFDEHELSLSSAAARVVARLNGAAGLLAAMVLTPAMAGCVSGASGGRAGAAAVSARRLRLSRGDWPSGELL